MTGRRTTTVYLTESDHQALEQLATARRTTTEIIIAVAVFNLLVDVWQHDALTQTIDRMNAKDEAVFAAQRRTS